MDTWYIDETFNKDGTTTFCAVLFDSKKSQIVKAKLKKIIKNRFAGVPKKLRVRLLSELKLSDLRFVEDTRILKEIIELIECQIIDVKYKTIKYQKANKEKSQYVAEYSKFIKSLGTEWKIVIDRCDSIKFSDQIVDETGNKNVSWGNSKESIGIQLADIMLYKKT